MGYGLLLIGFLICAIASWNVNATFKRYQSVSNRRGMTAAEAARQILNENGLQFIQIERVNMRSDIPRLKFGKPSFRLRSLARMHGILYWSWG